MAAYEQLRGVALGTGAVSGRGLGLILRGGLAAWMRAAGTVPVSCVGSSASASGPPQAVSGMVTLLSQMVMTSAGVRP